MTRKRKPADGPTLDERRDDDRTIGLIGAAVHAPLSQGRDGSFALELEGDDLAEPRGADGGPLLVRGEPTEPALHSPTSDHVEPRPVPTGECTVQVIGGASPCEEEDEER